jgi:hypothetical protein
MMFERRGDKLITRRCFFRRMVHSLFYACGVVAVSLVIGILGYHCFENLSWLDSLLNASMILGGMGPVDPVKSAGG